MNTLISINIGDKVKDSRGRIGTLMDIKLAPNGIRDLSLVAILYVKLESGNMIAATSGRFEPLPEIEYSEFYPSSHFSKLEK